MSRRNEKFRGSRTHGRGKKAGRGKGKRGGCGNAGLHKHKWIWTLKYDPEHFGRRGFKRHHDAAYRPKVINLWEVTKNLDTWVNEGKAKKIKDKYTVDLTAMGYDKLLGSGRITKKVNIKVPYATDRAIAKVEASGGKVEVSEEMES